MILKTFSWTSFLLRRVTWKQFRRDRKGIILTAYNFLEIHESPLKAIEESDSERDEQVTSQHTEHQSYQVNDRQLEQLLTDCSLPAQRTT